MGRDLSMYREQASRNTDVSRNPADFDTLRGYVDCIDTLSVVHWFLPCVLAGNGHLPVQALNSNLPMEC